MPEVVYYVAASLDARIATPEGGVEWLAPFEGAGEDYGYAKFYASVDAVLLGRRTYEQCLAFPQWPYPDRPCWVFSRRRSNTPRTGVTFTDRDPRQVLDELAARNLRRPWLVGGGELAGAFQTRGLVSEYIVSVVPVVLGAGIPLFVSGGAKQALKLVETTAYPNGIVQLRYVRGAEG